MTLQPSAYTNDRPQRRTILLVEDEPFVREATCSILEHAGFEVLPAEDARDAMKVVVLVTSGYNNPEYETEAPESRTYFLAKPYSRRTLVDKIEKILGTVLVGRAATQAG